MTEKTEKTYTSDWFSSNIPVWKPLLDPIAHLENLRGLEIGVYQGRSSCWLLENVFTHETAHLDAVDTFDGPKDVPDLWDTYSANVAEYGARITKHRMPSAAFLRPRKPVVDGGDGYDFIYIDGDHKSWSVLEDLVLSWPLLKVGGILFLDDYGGGVGHAAEERPKTGIDAFAAAYVTRYRVLNVGYQVAMTKLW